MTGETVERVRAYHYQCSECGAFGPTRAIRHDPDCPILPEVNDSE
jgi:hypothetical protein